MPVQADAACTINRGFVRLHDAAAAGTVVANYQTCHENAEQLRAMQVWVSEMQASLQ